MATKRSKTDVNNDEAVVNKCLATKNKKQQKSIESKIRIIEAAKDEFTSHGFDAARIDEIAKRAEVNKQLIYYYFESKDNLFTEVLKESYINLRKAEVIEDLDSLSAYEAIMRLVELDWNFYTAHPELIFMLASENLQDGIHIENQKETFWEINKVWGETTAKIFEKNKVCKTIRDDLDPMQLNITIASLVIFYIMNIKTLSLSFDVNLNTQEKLDTRLSVIKEIVGTWIKPR